MRASRLTGQPAMIALPVFADTGTRSASGVKALNSVLQASYCRRAAVVSGRDPGAGQSFGLHRVSRAHPERGLHLPDVEKVCSIDEPLIAIRGVVNLGRGPGERPAGQ